MGEYCKKCGLNKVQTSVYCTTCSTSNVPQGQANDRERSAYVQLAEVRAIAEQSLNNLPYGFTAESETTNLISALLRIIDITKS